MSSWTGIVGASENSTYCDTTLYFFNADNPRNEFTCFQQTLRTLSLLKCDEMSFLNDF